MKRFYLILSTGLFIFFLIPKINTSYDGMKLIFMGIASIVGEAIIPLVIWYILYLIAMKFDRLKTDTLLGYKLLLIVCLGAATTSIGLIFPEYAQLFNSQ